MGTNKLFVISGPSGAGKSALVSELLKRIPQLEKSISVTTRKPRKGEKDGESYFFVSTEEFEAKIKRGEFLEWAKVHGNLYGTLSSLVEEKLKKGKSVVLEIDVQGAAQVKKKCSNCVLIFILPPDLQTLEKRLKKRATEDEDALKMRLKRALEELEEVPQYEYIVLNDEFEKAVDELEKIVKGELKKGAN
jgi:guanylate kinase